MRKAVCTIVLALGVIFGAATSAVAQSYPPVASPLSISASVAATGQALTVSGTGAAAGATVIFTFASTPVVVATTTANDSGDFSATFRVPEDAEAGLHTVTATSNGEVLGTVTVRVLATATDRDVLAFTGFNGTLKLGIGLAMILLGVVLLLAIRRRRAGASA